MPHTLNRKEIQGPEEIRLLVNTFYYRAKKDDLLSVFFAHGMGNRPHALEPLYAYWENILMEEEITGEMPFPKHADLPLTHQHFDRWLSLFLQTVDDLFIGVVAERAKFRAIKMCEVFRYKMELTSF